MPLYNTSSIDGKSPTGEATTENPALIGGVDSSGLKRNLLTTTDGAVIAFSAAKISTSNSTTTPLGAGGTFTGTAEEIKDYAHLSVFLFSDQSSAASGFIIEWSQDGTNWDSNDTFSYDPLNEANKLYSFGSVARYFRIRYINGATPQGVFRLQTILHPFSGKPSSHRIGDTLSKEADAELVKAVLSGADDGQFINVQATPTGRLKVSAALEFENFADLGQAFLYSAPQTNFGTGGTELSFVYLVNPAGSGKTLKLRNMVEGVVSTNKPTTFRLYTNPIVTANGTSQTPVNKRIGDANTSIVQLFTSPTVTSFGTQVSISVVVAGVFTVEEANTLQILPGNSILFSVLPTTNNTECTVSLDWAEV